MTMEEALASVPARVAKGVEVLDREFPGWVDTFELKEFRITEYCNCVIGQIGNERLRPAYSPKNGYSHVLEKLLPQETRELRDQYAIDHGFDAETSCGYEEYQALQAEWTQVIQERQNRRTSEQRL